MVFTLFLTMTLALTITNLGVMRNLEGSKLQSNASPERKGGLELGIRMNKETYRRQEDPILRVAFKNVGREPLALYKKMHWGVGSSLFLELRETNGKWLYGSVVSEASDAAPFPEGDFITLHPGEEFVLSEAIGLESEGVTSTGTYDLRVFYHSPVSEKDAPRGMNVFTKEKGTLQSKPVTFTVVQ